MAIIAVTLCRLLLPLAITTWPLGGVLASLLMDAVDLQIITALTRQQFSAYQQWDKALDLYYLTFAWLVSRSWRNTLARKTSNRLIAIRIIGVGLFTFTLHRPLLFFFPNLFEHFYLYYLSYWRIYRREPFRSRWALALTLAALLTLKLGQEYVIHYGHIRYWEWVYAAWDSLTHSR